jgi:hypothetical protein
VSQRVAGVPPVVATGEPEGLNQVEIEFSVLSRQCLDRRIATQQELTNEIKTWQEQRNTQKNTVNWCFLSADARIKLERLYPVLEPQD